jgi:hypothetical protein
MEYVAAMLGGIAASAAFWVIDKYSLNLPQSYQLGGMIACFVVFGIAGFWLSPRGVTHPPPVPTPLTPGARIASGLDANT